MLSMRFSTESMSNAMSNSKQELIWKVWYLTFSPSYVKSLPLKDRKWLDLDWKESHISVLWYDKTTKKMEPWQNENQGLTNPRTKTKTISDNELPDARFSKPNGQQQEMVKYLKKDKKCSQKPAQITSLYQNPKGNIQANFLWNDEPPTSNILPFLVAVHWVWKV